MPTLRSFTTNARYPSAALNRRNLLWSLVPLFVVFTFCLLALVQRAVRAATEKPFGNVSPSEAQQIANDYCTQITGGPVHTGEASQQRAFSRRRQTIVREWDVVCNTGNAEYLLRINADTKQIFGVNRLTTSDPASDAEHLYSTAQAEVLAKRYLTILGVPVHQLQPVNKHAKALADAQTGSCSFTYRLAVKGLGKRLLSVSVDSTTGRLVCAWTPAYAL